MTAIGTAISKIEHKIYRVGGCVRDELLGKTPQDHDFVIVGATADEIAELQAVGFTQVGADFPVFLHPLNGDEYALARVERKTGVGYGGFDVSTENVSIEEDLSRRDLTMNAMAVDHTGSLIDPYGGAADLAAGILRHVSDSFSEDPLRVIRLARFAARMGFQIAPETLGLARGLVQSGEMEHISVERYFAEVFKVFKEETSVFRFFSVLDDLGVFEHVSFFKYSFPRFRELDAEKMMNALQSLRINPKHNAATRAFFGGAELACDALYAVFGAQDKYFPNTRARGLANIFRSISDLPEHFSANDLFDVFQRARAFNHGSLVVEAIEVIEALGGIDFVNKILMPSLSTARAVTSDNYQHLIGKAIGEAIKAERIARISDAITGTRVSPLPDFLRK